MCALKFVCTETTFRPVTHNKVRWLNQDKDFPLVQSWVEEQKFEPLLREEWYEMNKDNQYCAAVVDGKIVSIASAWKASDSPSWLVAGVYTAPAFRSQGYARAACSLITSYILEYCDNALCQTMKSNTPMIKVLESLGFCKVESLL